MEIDAKQHGCNDLHLEETELRLGLPGSDATEKPVPVLVSKSNKRASSGGTRDAARRVDLETAPATKVQVVGWPPVRYFRLNNLNASSASKKEEADTYGIYVKVGMDGAPYLRKIDLKTYRDYQDLLKALEKMFSCFTMGEFGKRDASEYVPTYQDRDGDWMLVGDVPWEMFASSCKRLRIMKGSEARGPSAEGSSHD